MLFEQLASIDLGDRERTKQLRQRYLALMLDALHTTDAPPLPGPAAELGGDQCVDLRRG